MMPSCAICTENLDLDYSNNDVYVSAITPCGHVFHTKCIIEWYHTSLSCPVCREFSHKWKLVKLYFFIEADEQFTEKAGFEKVINDLIGEIEVKNIEIKKLKEENAKLKTKDIEISTLKKQRAHLKLDNQKLAKAFQTESQRLSLVLQIMKDREELNDEKLKEEKAELEEKSVKINIALQDQINNVSSLKKGISDLKRDIRKQDVEIVKQLMEEKAKLLLKDVKIEELKQGKAEDIDKANSKIVYLEDSIKQYKSEHSKMNFKFESLCQLEAKASELELSNSYVRSLLAVELQKTYHFERKEGSLMGVNREREALKRPYLDTKEGSLIAMDSELLSSEHSRKYKKSV